MNQEIQEIFKFRRILEEIKDIDKRLKINKKIYNSEMSWINLEKADTNKDWETFKKIWEKSPYIFTKHILLSFILDFNIIKKLNMREELFNKNYWKNFDKNLDKLHHDINVWLKLVINK